MTDRLGKRQLYFVGQAHNNKANTILEKELLFALSSKHKVRYNVLEYAHSAAFLINQYLQTGQDSLLAFINPEANFNFIRAVKAFNDTISNDRKIQFYGLDFENRYEGKYTRKAIGIILQQTKLPEKEFLFSLLHSIAGLSTKDLNANLIKLRSYLKDNENKSRLLLGNYYIDVLLIANAQYSFSPKRDEAMIANFYRLYNELIRNGEQPAFFASFGTGHINPRNSNGIAMKLMKDEKSPVRNKVCIIGIQYFNCQFNKEAASKPTDGSLNFLCKNSVVRQLTSIQNDKSEMIDFLPKEELNKLNCDKAIEQFSGLFIIRNFSATTFWIWE